MLDISLSLHPRFNGLVGVALVVTVLWGLWILLLPRRSMIDCLPLPPGAEFLWGHERQVFVNQPGRLFRQWIGELGLTIRIKAAFGAPDILVLTDPMGIHHILQKRIYDYHHSKVVRPRVARFLGKGLGWVEGETEHKRMKQLVGPSLTAENIKGMAADVRDAATRVLNDLEFVIQTTEDGCGINILDWTGKAALNVVGRVAFLHDFDGGNNEEAERILNAKGTGARAISRYAGFLTLMMLRRFTILNSIPIPAIQAQGAVKMTIDAGVSDEIIKRNKGFVTDGKDLLSRLLKADLPTGELHEHISTFIVAGHEATTLTLGYSIYELARHPAMQQRLRDELMTFPGEPTYDDYHLRLPYLDAVLKETLRLYPGLPYMERVATKPDVIPLQSPITLKNGQKLHEIEVQPGQTVLIPIIAIHRMDSIWDEPDKFRPERWLGYLPPKEQLPSGWANTLAFSDGPRSCIGARFAIFQYKVILSGLLKRFRFSDTGIELSLKIASSLQPWVVGQEEKGTQLPVVAQLA